MNNQQHFAVVGAGIAGLSTALLLKQSGHEVTIIEKFPSAQPVGAGLVLQPTGLMVLKALGVHESIVGEGATITEFSGRDENNSLVYQLDYKKLNHNFFALGVHRHTLFQSLITAAHKQQITIITNFRAKSLIKKRNKYSVLNQYGQPLNGFDLIIDASGCNSYLRDGYAAIKRKTTLNYGALWTIVKKPDEFTECHKLRQWIQGATRGIGIFPIGKLPDCPESELIALHWSMRNEGLKHWQQTPLREWKKEALALCPVFSQLQTQIHYHSDFVYANYQQVVLNKLSAPGIVFIGDAGHAMNPRLGHGANLALVDALLLASSIDNNHDLIEALESFENLRRRHIAYYHMTSRWLGWLFQSNNNYIAGVRNQALRKLCQLSFAHKSMLKSLAGLKTGLLSNLDLSTLMAS